MFFDCPLGSVDKVSRILFGGGRKRRSVIVEIGQKAKFCNWKQRSTGKTANEGRNYNLINFFRNVIANENGVSESTRMCVIGRAEGGNFLVKSICWNKHQHDYLSRPMKMFARPIWYVQERDFDNGE